MAGGWRQAWIPPPPPPQQSGGQGRAPGQSFSRIQHPIHTQPVRRQPLSKPTRGRCSLASSQSLPGFLTAHSRMRAALAVHRAPAGERRGTGALTEGRSLPMATTFWRDTRR